MRLSSPGTSSSMRSSRNTSAQGCEQLSFAINSNLCDTVVLNTCQNIAKSSGKSKCRSTIWLSPIVSLTSSKSYILPRRQCISKTKTLCAPKTWKLCTNSPGNGQSTPGSSNPTTITTTIDTENPSSDSAKANPLAPPLRPPLRLQRTRTT